MAVTVQIGDRLHLPISRNVGSNDAPADELSTPHIGKVGRTCVNILNDYVCKAIPVYISCPPVHPIAGHVGCDNTPLANMRLDVGAIIYRTIGRISDYQVDSSIAVDIRCIDWSPRTEYVDRNDTP